MIAADSVPTVPSVTPTPSASPSSPTATGTSTVTASPTAPGGSVTATPGAASLSALVALAASATFKATYVVESHSADVTDTVHAARMAARMRETLASRAGITGSTNVRDGGTTYICEEEEPFVCETASPGSQAAQSAFQGPWWTNRAATALTGGGGQVVTAPGRTVAGVAATCFKLQGEALPELCLDPANGAVLYLRTGEPGERGYTLTAISYAPTASSSDFALPYPIN
jgi:hypothetical protein